MRLESHYCGADLSAVFCLGVYRWIKLEAGRDRIRTHLATIARDFAQGRFDLPTRIHDQTPPGVESMQRLKSTIRYRYAPTPRGGRVEISTENAEALAAIHQFLRFQIDEHRTEDRSF